MFTLLKAYSPKHTFKVKETERKKQLSRFLDEKSGDFQYFCFGRTNFRIIVKLMLTMNWMNKIYVYSTTIGWLKLNTLRSNLFVKLSVVDDAP